MKKMMLIDGSSLLFRSFYATMPADPTKVMKTSTGIATNAIYGLAGMIFRLLGDYKPDYTLVAFDTWAPTVRHENFEDYKSTRKPAPDEMIAQFPLSRELFECFGIVVYENAGVEADDIIGTMAKIGSKNDLEVMIVSGDKDLLQLIDGNVSVYLTKKGVSELERMDEAALMEKYTLTPKQIPDFKGLMGDPSDNIPGIKGVGEKTAIKLLNEYGNMETILDAPIKGSIGEKIKSSREIALLSKQLATIMVNLDLPFTIENTIYQGIDENRLRKFFDRYEMRSLINKINSISKQKVETKEMCDGPQKIIKTAKIGDYLENKPFSIIVEQLTKNYFLNPIVAIAVSQNNVTYHCELDDLLKDKKLLSLLENPSIDKYAYDIKQTVNALAKYKVKINSLIFDLTLTTYLLESRLDDDESTIFAYHGANLPFGPKMLKNLSIDEIDEYASCKAYYVFTLKDKIMNELKKNNLYELYQTIELPLAFILAKMEKEGIKLDVDLMNKMSIEVQKTIDELTTSIHTLATHPFNINSPNQLAEVLYDELGLKSNRKRSTSVDYLEEIKDEHPIINAILQYRKNSKLQSTYLQGIPLHLHSDGKIHTIFNQSLTQTGRLSSKEPNLQNITIRNDEQRIIRKAFLPSKNGNYILSVDYSQIELRVLAHMANATSLIDAFNHDEDIHTQTAMKLFNIEKKEDVLPLQRSKAKAVNFGIIYGISDWGLAAQINVEVKEARAFIRRYFETYPEIKGYLDQQVEECETTGYVKTLFNRIRKVDEIHSTNYNVKEFGKRVAMNTPIQGSAADIIKKAMIDVDKMLKENNYQSKLILQIHDELIFDVPKEEIILVVDQIAKTMEECVNLNVRLKVDYGFGENWFEAK